MKKWIVCTALLSGCAAPSNTTPEPVLVAVESTTSIRPDAIRAHVNFLASDLLEGREAGTRGYDLAAAYVASHFERMGLTPAGDDASFFQSVPLRAAWRDIDETGMTVISGATQRTLVFGEDFLLRTSSRTTHSALDADAVFVGYGIDAANRNHDDYANLDVRGKVVVMLTGFPSGWPSEEGAYYSSGAHKSSVAEKHGALGMVYVYTRAYEAVAPWQRMTRNPHAMAMSWIQPDGQTHTRAPSVGLNGMLSPAAGAVLFAGATKGYEEVREEAANGAPAGFPLNVRLSMQAQSRHEDRASANVAGMVRGTDPQLRDEYIVLSGHLDHIGIGEPVDGDSINNGALDNAAGIAAMLEAARLLQANPARRSVIFLAVTAEEKGLLGSEYFAINPTVPATSIVANVNLDMPVLLYDFKDLIGFGSGHTSLEGTMRSALASMGLGLAPDPFPERAIFVRSDHFRFVEQGIPSVMLATGPTSDQGEGKGLEVMLGFLGAHYHQPGDEASLPIDYEAGARFGEVNFRLLQALANADSAPTWHQGDFFGERFSR